jgi:hypothetical protein
VIKGHPRERLNKTFIDMWSLFGGYPFFQSMTGWQRVAIIDRVIFIQMCSLTQFDCIKVLKENTNTCTIWGRHMASERFLFILGSGLTIAPSTSLLKIYICTPYNLLNSYVLIFL